MGFGGETGRRWGGVDLGVWESEGLFSRGDSEDCADVEQDRFEGEEQELYPRHCSSGVWGLQLEMPGGVRLKF